MNDKKSTYTDEQIAQARKSAPDELSGAIKELFDDEKHGGVFYAHIIQQMCRHFDDPRVPTAAVSVTDKINLYINPTFWMYELTSRRQRMAVLKHELGHLIFHHCYRIADFGNRMLANIAADCVVNSLIDGNVFGEKKKQFIFPENFGLPHDETLPFYYENFPVEDHPVCQNPSGHDKEHAESGSKDKADSSGSDSSSEDKGSEASGGTDTDGGSKGKGTSHDHAVGADGKCKVCGGLRTLDSHDVWSEEEGAKISESMKRSLINDAINRAADASSKTAGNLPNAIKQAIEVARKKPQIPWTLILRQFVSKLSTGVLTHTKKRESKRFHTRPGPKINPKLKMLLSLDVSGSISDKEYETFINEGLAILKNAGIGSVDVLEWDAAVTSVDLTGKPTAYKLKSSYKVTRTGSGGTDPAPAIHWINEHKSKYDGVVWFTDGHFFSDLPERVRLPSLWVVTKDGSEEYLKKKNYRTIRLPKSEDAA